MKHEYENNIKCPYCNWEDKDSWELQEDEDIVTCGSCEKDFNVTRDIEVTYSTSKIKCEENNHNFIYDHKHIQKRSFEDK